MSRIRSTRQARNLRPLAIERARQSKLTEGSTVFYGGVVYGDVKLYRTIEHKPNKLAILEGKSAMFYGTLTHAYPTHAEYEASGIHWRFAS